MRGNLFPPLTGIMRSLLYHEGLARWRASWERKQILVLNFDAFISQARSYMRLISDFVDLELGDLPHSNELTTRYKVESMCCETWCAIAGAHADGNAALYRMLDADYEGRLGPEVEPRFERFPAAPDSCRPCAHASYEYIC